MLTSLKILMHLLLLLGFSTQLMAFAQKSSEVKQSDIDLKRHPIGTEIVDRLGNQIETKVKMIRQDDVEVSFDDYFHHEKPVVFILGYYKCPMLCSLVLSGAMESLEKIDFKAGKDYSLVALSIDHRESSKVAKDKRENYLKKYKVNPEGVFFHTASKIDIAGLAEQLGFGYKYDDDIDQYAHGAGIFVLSPDGLLSRTLWGVKFNPGDLKFSLVDAANGRVGTVIDKLVMSCFQYYSDNHKYGLYIWGVMRLGGAITLFLLVLLLTLLWRKEKINKVSAL